MWKLICRRLGVFPLLLFIGRFAEAGSGNTTGTILKLKSVPAYALGDGAASLDGVYALGLNPAGLAFTQRAELSAQYDRLLLNTQAGQVGFAIPVHPWKAVLGLSYASLNSAQFEGRNALGQRTADFSIQDQLLGIHAAKPLLIGSNLQPVTLGASVKYLRSQIAGLRADAFLLDLGLRYALGNLPLSFGLGVLHLGSGVKFVDQESRLPTRVNFGAAYQLAGPMTLVGSVDEHIHERRRDYTIGLQYQAGGIMTLRGRYNLTQGGLRQEGGGFLNFAGGFGVNFWGGSSLDYAFQPLAQDLEGSGIHRFSFTMRFGRNLPLDLARKRRLEPLPYDLRDALRDQKPGEQAKDGEQGKQKEGNWKGKSKDTGTGDVWKIVNDLEKESRKKSKGKKAKKEDADSEKNRNSEEESDETAPEAIVIW